VIAEYAGNSPYRNHTIGWVLRDIPERRRLRTWFSEHALPK